MTILANWLNQGMGNTLARAVKAKNRGTIYWKSMENSEYMASYFFPHSSLVCTQFLKRLNCRQYFTCSISIESDTFTHIKLWKESGIIDKRIKLYSSSQVAPKSSSTVPAPGIVEIRLESARAHATSFYSVN